MKLGYIPDSFGHNQQLPQILNNFNFDKAVFWRGVSEEKSKALNFNWELGKYKVKVANIRFGYALGKYLPIEDSKINKRLKIIFNKLDPYIGEFDYVLGNGHDQMPIQTNLVKVLSKINNKSKHNFKISTFSEYIDSQDYSQAKTVVGELMDSQFSRIHRTMASSRMDIKMLGAKLENEIIHIVEPLTAIAKKLNINYEKKWMDEIWELLALNNAHDSIGGCVSDDVADNIISRYKKAKRMMESITEDIKRQIIMGIDNSKESELLVVYNLTPFTSKKRYEVEIISRKKSFDIVEENGSKIDYRVITSDDIEVGMVNKRLRVQKNVKYYRHVVRFNDEIPSLGFKAYDIVESKMKYAEVKVKSIDKLENQFYIIDINKNGTINIFDKKINKNFTNQLLMINEENVGDTYDYSPLEEESIKISSKDVKASFDILDYEDYQEAKIKYDWKLPKDISERKKGKKTVFNKVAITVKLPKESRNIQFNVNYENNACDQRTRILIDTHIEANKVSSFQAYGPIERSTKLLVKENWVERFLTTYPFVNIVGAEQDDTAFNVMSKSLREYDFIDKTKLALTLVSSVEFLGLSDLTYRPGRSSGIPVHTPKAQMIGRFESDFTINTQRNISKANLQNMFHEYITENMYFNKRRDMEWNKNTDARDIKVPRHFSLLELESKDVAFETLKISQDTKSIILRLSNPSANRIDWNPNYSTEVKMDEKTAINNDGFCPLEVRTWKIK